MKKYTPVFGPQELFDGAPDDVDMIGHSGGHYKNTPNGILYCGGCTFTADELRNTGFIAMRRIIKTPVWTVADQKAGRLPEVGAKYIGKNELNPETELICDFVDGDKCVWGHDKNKKMFCFYVSNITAIETPEERAQRLRDDWVVKAVGETAVFAGVTKAENEILKIHLNLIYDALLSGELASPKGGE